LDSFSFSLEEDCEGDEEFNCSDIEDFEEGRNGNRDLLNSDLVEAIDEAEN
jgi:hypothetical protein